MLSGAHVEERLPGSQLLYLSPISIVRDSLNDATDDDHVVLASVSIPGGLVVPGQSIDLEHEWQCTNSANTKNMTVLVNATGVFAQNQTTLVGYRWITRLHAVSNTVLRCLGGSPIYGNVGAGANDVTVNLQQGFTLSFRGRWTTQPISGESITLISARVMLYG